MLTIQKGVQPREFKAGRWIVTARQMEEGDSVLVATRGHASAMKSAINQTGYVAISRREGDQIRVWRLGPYPGR